ncbi:MAG: TonB-dependent receptor [Bacteroidota bacterium]|nr:TonB-dependent receptor [Bacteroidota bacterium]
MMQHYRFVFLFLSVFTTYSFLVAGTTGKISGKVTDSKTKEGIPSAVVAIVGTTLGAATDAEGSYVIVNVPPGTYSISVSYVGYQPTRITNIGVNVDFTTTLNIQLKESSVELNEFVVEGERTPLIRQDQTNPVASITAENMQSLPVTTISEVIGLQAGVVTSDDGALHVRGGRSNEIAFTLNGISVNDPYNNLSSIGVATNAVQEVTVSTGTFSAEYGNALSGIVNYVTKEGGSKNSGSVKVLTGDYYSKRTDVFPHIDKFQPLNNGRVEATLGGPTLLDELSFYLSGVYDRTNGYLYGNRIYNPKDMFVTRDEFTKRYPYLNLDGSPHMDPTNAGFPYYANDSRLGSNGSPYFFNPLGSQVYYQREGDSLAPKFDRIGKPGGDSALVPLNTSQSYNIQGNLLFRLSSTMRLKYEFVYDNGKSQSTSYYGYRFNPDGRPTSYSNGIVQALDWTHTISNSMFYTVKASYNSSHDKTYTYEDIHDPRYLPEFYQTSLPIVGFLTGGTSLGRSFRNSQAIGTKIDLQAQLFDVHEVKMGAELRMHTIDVESYTLQFDYQLNDSTRTILRDFQQLYNNDALKYSAKVPDVNSGYVSYTKKPTQFSLYLQDKIELEKSFILNAGVRYEYFDPGARYNPNLSEAISARDTSFLVRDLKKASIKHSISPRLSIAYPITDQGVIRFSYGHFYQLGNLSSLYTNTNFRVAGSQPVFGNADVKPQRSVQYEIGLQQGLTPDLRLEVVGFYKDVRDYIFTQIVVTAKGDVRYNVLTNLDYANSRGLTVSLFQRRAPGSLFSSSIDYTFSVAEGNRTEPRDDFFYSEKSGKSVETFLVPLSFDRTHTLTSSMNLSEPDNFSVGTIIRMQSGSPYTASIPASLSTQISNFIQNSSTKPFQWTVDLKFEKYFSFGGFRYSVFLHVDNLFDLQNEIDVYSNSGKALYNANLVANPSEFSQIRQRINRGDVGLIPLSAVDGYFNDPQNVSRPRLTRFGVSILF